MEMPAQYQHAPPMSIFCPAHVELQSFLSVHFRFGGFSDIFILAQHDPYSQKK